jgi:hypothetical protein
MAVVARNLPFSNGGEVTVQFAASPVSCLRRLQGGELRMRWLQHITSEHTIAQKCSVYSGSGTNSNDSTSAPRRSRGASRNHIHRVTEPWYKHHLPSNSLLVLLCSSTASQLSLV